MAGKIVHHDWVYQTLRPGIWNGSGKSEKQDKIREAVHAEIEKLDFSEKEFMRLFWFEGRSLSEIGELLGKKPYKLECLNKRIMRKLKIRLADFVRREFDIVNAKETCRICDHPQREAIDKLLRAKKPQETYHRVIKILREEYGLDLKTPQAIIGHIKYHIREE